MNVRQLIEALQALPPDAPVLLDDMDYGIQGDLLSSADTRTVWELRYTRGSYGTMTTKQYQSLSDTDFEERINRTYNNILGRVVSLTRTDETVVALSF